ncbi:MAG: outer membrane beta-barrel protein [Proteiniphilum sp.]|jgi:hypothetical protein|nr:outer membrane beta-barrel protein [Proteiniphilum sp.]
MKRVFILIFFLALFFAPEVRAQFEGTFGLGVHAGYGAAVNSAGGGVHAHYYYTNNIRFAPSFTYFIERKGKGMWMTDADAHYILPLSYSASLYPVAGVHYSQWRYDASKSSGASPQDCTKHRLGANLGLGFQHDIAYRVRANFELKYQFIPDYSQALFTAGIGFWF